MIMYTKLDFMCMSLDKLYNLREHYIKAKDMIEEEVKRRGEKY